MTTMEQQEMTDQARHDLLMGGAIDALEGMLDGPLREIAFESVAAYAQLLAESADDISTAIAHHVEDMDDETGKIPPVRVTHSLVIDLHRGEVRDGVSVSVRHRREQAAKIRDPRQPELGII
jgi:hypothetical protein